MAGEGVKKSPLTVEGKLRKKFPEKFYNLNESNLLRVYVIPAIAVLQLTVFNNFFPYRLT